MSERPYLPEAARLDGDDILRELRLQLEAVKARMQEHRETMEAAGLAAPRPRAADDLDGPCTGS